MFKFSLGVFLSLILFVIGYILYRKTLNFGFFHEKFKKYTMYFSMFLMLGIIILFSSTFIFIKTL